MPEQILHTKLVQSPLRHGVISRPKLLERLQTAWQSGQRLALIEAPAGYGKTTLALSWLAQLPAHGVTVAWLSLDERDDRVDRLLQYMIAAVNAVLPQLGLAPVGSMSKLQQADLNDSFRIFVNAIAAYDEPVVLALDDIHHLQSPEALAVLADLVDHAPRNLYIVATSREEPALPLPKWRARSAMSTISAIDLRFDENEAAKFLNKTMRLQLGTSDVERLLRQTEGWIAGLQLAAISVQQGASATEIVADFGGQERLIVDYLTSEVMVQQTDAVRNFLLRTSILDRLCAPLCRRLVGDVDAQAMLEYLDRGNLFLVPLDRNRRWYRYHHLFAELLRSRLQHTRPPAEVSQLHRIASGWFEEQGLAEEAIEHAVAAGDSDHAAQIVAALPIDVLWEPWGAMLLSGWLKQIPEEVVDAYPRVLLLAAGAFLLQGQASQALGVLERLSRHESMAAEYGLLKAIIVRNEGQYDQARKMILAVVNELERREPLLGMLARLQLAVIDADTGRLDEARAFSALVRVEAASADPPLATPWLQGTQLEALAGFAQGDLVEAEKLARETQQAVTASTPMTTPMVGLLDGVLGSIYYQWNEIEKAEHCFLKARKGYEQTGISDLLFAAGFGLADLALLRGDYQEVERWLGEFRRVVARTDVPAMQDSVASMEAVLRLRMGQIRAATKWADASGLSLDDRSEYLTAHLYMRLAKVRLAEDMSHGVPAEPHKMLALLNFLLALYKAAGHRLNVIECHLMIALQHHLAGEIDSAVETLQKALEAARSGYVQRLFLDFGAPLQELLEVAAARHISPRQVRRLLAAFAIDEARSSVSESPQGDALAADLTERELEVLALLVDGLTNREIAERLVISKNTIRTHIKNIYSKLDVHSRVEAAARSHELKLLPRFHPPNSV